MKKLITITVILLVGMTSNSQTKEETVNWLNQKFVEYKDINVVMLQIENEDKDNEVLMLVNHYGSFADMYKIISSQINAVRLYRTEDGNYNIKIISSAGFVEKSYGFDKNRKPVFEKSRKTNEINLVFDNSFSSGTKMRKALIHLINLTGGSILSDDLFK